jgi:nucleoid DNA-binding protein
MRQGRNPQTGDKIDIPGSASIKVSFKPNLDKDLVTQCKEQIKKLVKI